MLNLQCQTAAVHPDSSPVTFLAACISEVEHICTCSPSVVKALHSFIRVTLLSVASSLKHKEKE